MSEIATITFEDMECVSCGIHYKLPDNLLAIRKRDGHAFYCPNGHRQHFTDSHYSKCDELKARCERLESENKRLSAKVDTLQDQLAASEARLNGKSWNTFK